MKIDWHCEQHDAGFLIIAKIGDAAFAHHITRANFKTEHEPGWAFWSVIRGLARAVDNFTKIQVGKMEAMQ